MQTYLLNQVIEDYLDDVCQYVKIGRKMFCELCELCGDHHPQADVVADAHVNDALSLCDHEQFSFQEQKILRKSKKSAKKAKKAKKEGAADTPKSEKKDKKKKKSKA